MPNLGSRTDLALESANTVKSEGQLPRGISADEKKTACFTVTSVEVFTEEAAKKIGKPVGRYITLETAARLDMKSEKFEQSVFDLAEEITSWWSASATKRSPPTASARGWFHTSSRQGI